MAILSIFHLVGTSPYCTRVGVLFLVAVDRSNCGHHGSTACRCVERRQPGLFDAERDKDGLRNVASPCLLYVCMCVIHVHASLGDTAFEVAAEARRIVDLLLSPPRKEEEKTSSETKSEDDATASPALLSPTHSSAPVLPSFGAFIHSINSHLVRVLASSSTVSVT